ncbi:MAG: class II aldolase/adducin family protein [Actinomycetota bacterium]
MITDLELERHKRLRELALGYRIFGALRWGDLGDGHITARDPERTDCFWVLGAFVSFHRATMDDLILIGPDGTAIEGGPAYNRTAYNIHWPVHEARPDIVAAAHTHTGWSTPFSASRKHLLPISQEACMFYDDHSVFDDEEVQVQSVAGGERIATALDGNRAVILANHGFLSVGASVAEAVAAFVVMDRVAEVQMKAPDAVPISEEGARRAKAGLGPARALEAGFRYLVDRHIGDPAVVGPPAVPAAAD